jgi:hypothetical protein
MTPKLVIATSSDQTLPHKRISKNIFHKNREISILTMKKKQQSKQFLRKPQANTFSGSYRKNQTRGDKTKRKIPTGMNRSANLTPVQGSSTVVCMIVISQLPH